MLFARSSASFEEGQSTASARRTRGQERESLYAVRLLLADPAKRLCVVLPCGALPGKKKPEPLVENVLRVSLKGTVKDSSDTLLILDTAADLAKLASSGVGDEQGGPEHSEIPLKVQAGRCLRKIGERWRVALVLALVSAQEAAGDGDTEQAAALFVALEKRIVEEWCLIGCWDMKPLLDGGKICQVNTGIATRARWCGASRRLMLSAPLFTKMGWSGALLMVSLAR